MKRAKERRCYASLPAHSYLINRIESILGQDDRLPPPHRQSRDGEEKGPSHAAAGRSAGDRRPTCRSADSPIPSWVYLVDSIVRRHLEGILGASDLRVGVVSDSWFTLGATHEHGAISLFCSFQKKNSVIPDCCWCCCLCDFIHFWCGMLQYCSPVFTWLTFY